MNKNYIVSFFATPLINYTKLFETQSRVISPEQFSKNKKR